ncbi:hypothetical protein C5167_047181, partial [Papaver somniferum]
MWFLNQLSLVGSAHCIVVSDAVDAGDRAEEDDEEGEDEYEKGGVIVDDVDVEDQDKEENRQSSDEDKQNERKKRKKSGYYYECRESEKNYGSKKFKRLKKAGRGNYLEEHTGLSDNDAADRSGCKGISAEESGKGSSLMGLLQILPKLEFAGWRCLYLFASNPELYFKHDQKIGFNKNKKLVKKLANKYHVSETVIKQVPRLLGPGLNKAGKKVMLYLFWLTQDQGIKVLVNAIQACTETIDSHKDKLVVKEAPRLASKTYLWTQLYQLREERDMNPETFSSLVSAIFYEKRDLSGNNFSGVPSSIADLEHPLT